MVSLRTKARVISCNDQGINVILNGDKRTFIEGRKLVTCLSYRPADQLGNGLRGKLPRINCVGDCRQPGKLINAISEAYTVATQT